MYSAVIFCLVFASNNRVLMFEISLLSLSLPPLPSSFSSSLPSSLSFFLPVFLPQCLALISLLLEFKYTNVVLDSKGMVCEGKNQSIHVVATWSFSGGNNMASQGT